jgi:sulfoxide reductase heme-binding subunit YedZ
VNVDPGPHLFWITSRAAGTAALMLISISLTIGLLMGGRLVRGRGRGADMRTLHESLSLSALAMLALHGLALLGDPYLHPSPTQIVIPFTIAYRPLWTGLGIIGGWLLIVLGLSFYWRESIGVNRWKALHRFTILGWGLAVVHTIGAGSDARTTWYLVLIALPIAPALVLLCTRLAGLFERSAAAATPRS